MNHGKHLIVGFEGTWPEKEWLQWLRNESIGGVILFARNIESRQQLVELIRCLRDARPDPFMISVDHEGGRVFRLPEPFTAIPPARLFGQYYERTQDIAEIEEIAALIAAELLEVGFNLNFAPVLDVDTCPENPIIGDRAFHQDPAIVAGVALAMIRGFDSRGLLSCGKHFPGHGDTKEDSHQTVPVVSVARDILEQREWIPFRHAVRVGIPSLMTAHVLYPELDAERCATLSPLILQQILRDDLGFRGVLFSDDLLMAGITADRTVAEAAVESLRAGCDALLICRDFGKQQEALEAIRETSARDSALERRLAESSSRLDHLLHQLAPFPPPVPSPAQDPHLLATRLAALK